MINGFEASWCGTRAQRPFHATDAVAWRSDTIGTHGEERVSAMATYTMTIDGIVAVDRALHVEIGSRYVLGRASDSDFPLPDSDRKISRHHAAAEGTVGGIRIRDLGSANGTFVNGIQVDAAVLRPGDRVRIGKTVLVVGKMDPSLPKVFGLFRPNRRSSAIPTETTSKARSGRFAWTEVGNLVCPSCGASWPPSPKDQDGGCSTCQPRRALDHTDPRRIGPFEVVSVIGTGPNSIVYEVTHRITGMRTALKRPLWREPTREQQGAFLERAREDASLHHPRIARTYEAVLDKETEEIGVSMEWLRAGNCKKLAGGKLPVAATLLLGADLFDALAFLHAMGLVHGSVKPDNLLLARTETDEWRGKLADHGCHLPGGNPGFTAPELADTEMLPTTAADIYSAAATLFFLLTGTLPFAERPLRTGPGSSDHPRISLAAHLSDVPPEIVDLLDNALAPDPAARCAAHAGEIALQLRRVANSL